MKGVAQGQNVETGSLYGQLPVDPVGEVLRNAPDPER